VDSELAGNPLDPIDLSDGLPIIAPTRARVDELLSYGDWTRDDEIGTVPPRNGILTYEVAAANAAMTGCAPAQFWLVTEAIKAMLLEPFNLLSIQTTTHPAGPCVVFSGPAAAMAGVSAAGGCFGPGHPANARIGRAIRLILQNVGGARAGTLDRATFGTPAKWTFCFADKPVRSSSENWATLAEEAAGTGTANLVTVIPAEGPHNVNDHFSFTAHGLLRQVAHTLATVGANDPVNYPLATPMVVLSPEHARTVAGDGYTRQDAKEFIARHAQIPLGHWSAENIQGRFAEKWPGRYAEAGPLTGVPVVTAERLVLAVAGGDGKHSMVVPTIGTARCASRTFELVT
jgi:hypothetical protein